MKETLVAMSMKKHRASCQGYDHGLRGFDFAVRIEDGLPTLHTILDTSEIYKQCPFRDCTGLRVAYGVVIMGVEMLRRRVLVQSDV